MSTLRKYILLLAVTLTACSKPFLDKQNPNKTTTANFWKTESDLDAATAACYEPMTTTFGNYGDIGIETAEVRTENYSWIPGAYANYQIETFINDPNNEFTPTFYALDYRGVFYTNQVIEFGGAMKIADAIKIKYIAEAKFLRALYYFFLVNDFGAVPIQTKVPETQEDFRLAKSTKEEVWQQIVTDLEDASQGLPETRPEAESGRPTKGSALAYLGRALLYQGRWSEATGVLKSIVDNETAYHYGLRPNYAELFDGKHENETGGILEGVFEIQKSNVLPDQWSNYSSLLGILGAPAEVGGWDYFLAKRALVDSFLVEPAVGGGFDPRATATVAWDYPGCVFYTHDFHSFFDANRVYNRKYANWWDSSEGDGHSNIDAYGMRYADVLLMLAEAYTMQGQVAEAAPLVHRIRERAKLPNKLSELASYTKDQMMAEIRHQRNLEFAYEGLHWYDLQRWGLFEQVIKNSSEPGKENYQPKFQYYPIPQAELNANPKMTQTDGW